MFADWRFKKLSELDSNRVTSSLAALRSLGVDTSRIDKSMTLWDFATLVRSQVHPSQVDEFWLAFCGQNGYVPGRFIKKHGNFFDKIGLGIGSIFGNPEKKGVVAICEAVYSNRSRDGVEIDNAAILGEAARLGMKPQDMEQATILAGRLLKPENVGLVLSDFIGNMDGVSGNFAQAAIGEGQFRNIIPDWQTQSRINNAIADWIENGGYHPSRTLNPGEINTIRSGGFEALV